MTPQTAVNYAFTFLGLPYRWGGDDPIKGLDCSGLVIEILKGVGVLPNKYDATAQNLFNFLSANGAKLEETPIDGDIVFFGESVSKITHVGFCISDTLMIEAGGGGASVTNEDVASTLNAFIRIRPIKNRKDVVAYLKPNYANFTRGQ